LGGSNAGVPENPLFSDSGIVAKPNSFQVPFLGYDIQVHFDPINPTKECPILLELPLPPCAVTTCY
jgi:hypothetical protein